MCSEFLKREWLREPAHPANTRGRIGPGLKRFGIDHSKLLGKHIGDPTLRCVGVRVRREQRAITSNQRREKCALCAVFSHRMHTTEEQRMVGQEGIGVPFQGLVDGGSHGVYREQHAAQWKVISPSHQANPIPILRLGSRPQQFHSVPQVN